MNDIGKLAWRNIWRNWRRTILTSLSTAFGVMTLIFFQSYLKGVAEGFLENMVRSETSHVKLSHREFLRLEKILPKEHLIYGYKELEKNISKIPEIDLITERIKFRLVLSHNEINKACVGIGIVPEKEKRLINLGEYIVEGTYFTASPRDLLIGYKLAQALGVSTGDELLAVTMDLNFSTYALTFKVAGLFNTGFNALDKGYFYIPLESAQELLDCEEGVHEILTLVKNPSQAPKITGEINKILEENNLAEAITAVPWQDHFLVKFLAFSKTIRVAILFIVVLIAALVILNTMIMSVLERTREMGILKSMGMKKGEITLMILFEAFFIGIIGAAIGGAAGTALSVITQNSGIDFSRAFDNVNVPLPYISSVFYPDFTLWFLLNSIMFGIGVSLIASFYPALKAALMAPAEALRSGLK